MFTKFQIPRQAIMVAAMLAFIVVVVGASTVGAASRINAINPETGRGSQPVYHQAAPRLAPPGSAGYVPQQAGKPVAAPDGRPVAQLDVVPANLQNVTVSLPTPLTPPPAAHVAYQILASVRYEGAAHSVLVTTTRPTAAAAQQPTVFGSYTTQLANGTTAWARLNMPHREPNQVVFLHNDLIITVASDLSINDIKALAAQVVIR